MFMVYLLWFIVVLGGFYMGAGSAWAAYQNNFDFSLSLNAVIYLGCALYGLPHLVKLLLSKIK